MVQAGHGNDRPSRDESATRQIARRLIDSRRTEPAGANTPTRAAAEASGHLYQALSRWLGSDGCHALFSRAHAQARTEHAALEHIQLRARSEPYIDGVAAAIMAHGDPVTAEALEAVLVHLIELLGRLIGDDMALKLIERSVASTQRRDAESNDAREEA